MLFKPTNNYHILTEDEFSDEITVIEKELQNYSTSGKISSFDGCKLAYEYFEADNSIGSIILIHGFTEFYKKFYEMAWYFLNMGYSVFLYDQRGHGLSDRQVDNPQLTHINDFNDYVKDLDCIINNIVVPASADKPIYIFAHSMGGAVASMYLSENSGKIKRAILSSPMVCPKTHGIPGGMVKLISKRYAKKDGWEARFRHSGDFNPNPDFIRSSDSSLARFKHNLDFRIQHDYYQNSSFSNRWMYEALKVKKILLNSHYAKKIKTDVLIFSASKDRVVHTAPQRRLAKKLPHCTLVTIPGAKHTVYTGSGPMLDYFYETVISFFNN